jgi:DNA-binding CsgD family transcriptional regulator
MYVETLRFPGQSLPGQSLAGQSFAEQSFAEQSFAGQSPRARQAAAYLVVVNLLEWLAPISTEEQVVGRGEDAQIQLPSRFTTISRRHAKLWEDRHGNFWLKDIGSTFGTALNGVPLKSGDAVQIVLGDRVRLGKIELAIEGPLQARDRLSRAGLTDIDETVGGMSGQGAEHGDQLSCLTTCERDVLLWLARGYTALADIGKKLHRSPHTVRTQLASIFRKLDVHSRDELLGKLRRSELAAAKSLPQKSLSAAEIPLDGVIYDKLPQFTL